MKILTRGLIGVGFILMMLGGAGMDSASLVVPMIMAFSGVGMLVAGGSIEELYDI